MEVRVRGRTRKLFVGREDFCVGNEGPFDQIRCAVMEAGVVQRLDREMVQQPLDTEIVWEHEGHVDVCEYIQAYLDTFNLHTLTLSGVVLSMRDWSALSSVLESNRTVQRLVLQDVSGKATALHLEPVQASISDYTTLTELHIEKNLFSAETVQQCNQLLRANRSIKKWSFLGNQFESCSMQPLFEALRYNITVTSFAASSSVDKEQSGNTLAESLYSCCSLRSLRLQGHFITKSSAGALCQWIADTQQLRHLNLSQYDFGDQGACELAKAMHCYHGLRRIALAMCGIGGIGTQVLVDCMLTENYYLEDFSLASNPIDHLGLKSIADLFQSDAVQVLRLHGVKMGIPEKTLLSTALYENTSLVDVSGIKDDLIQKKLSWNKSYYNYLCFEMTFIAVHEQDDILPFSLWKTIQSFLTHTDTLASSEEAPYFFPSKAVLDIAPAPRRVKASMSSTLGSPIEAIEEE